MATKPSAARERSRLDLWLFLASLTALPLFAALGVIFADAVFSYQMSSLGSINAANYSIANLQYQVFLYFFVILAGGIVAGLTAQLLIRHQGAFDPRAVTNFVPIAILAYLAYGWGALSVTSSSWIYANVYIDGAVNWLLLVSLGCVLPIAYRLTLLTLDRPAKKR